VKSVNFPTGTKSPRKGGLTNWFVLFGRIKREKGGKKSTRGGGSKGRHKPNLFPPIKKGMNKEGKKRKEETLGLRGSQLS